jgi:chromosome segregation ATPase
MDEESLAPLIEFIGKKFDQADQRFDQVATKEEVRAQQAETRRHFEVVAEALRGQIQQVAEGVLGVEQRLDGVEQRLVRVEERFDRFEQKVEVEFAETRAAIRFSYAQLERRIQELESNYASLNERVGRLESRAA